MTTCAHCKRDKFPIAWEFRGKQFCESCFQAVRNACDHVRDCETHGIEPSSSECHALEDWELLAAYAEKYPPPPEVEDERANHTG